jgi:hypothetical protein
MTGRICSKVAVPAAALMLAAIGAVAALNTATGAAAGTSARVRVVHRSFDEPKETTHVSGLGPGCPAFVGRLIERRHLVITGYERGDRAHVSTVADATVRLIPDDPAAVSYRGTYRELQVGKFADHGHRTVHSTTFTLGQVRGSDGTSFETVEDARIWHDSDGRLHHTESFHC